MITWFDSSFISKIFPPYGEGPLAQSVRASRPMVGRVEGSIVLVLKIFPPSGEGPLAQSVRAPDS
jgi:hypothetical protein